LEEDFNIPIVLIAPLDWGLGHATRCIPVIKAFLQLKWKVVLAADGQTKMLLQQEFPFLQVEHITGYHIRYSTHANRLLLKIVSQIPKILSAIKNEHSWLSEYIQNHKIDLIVSDNRYGFYSKKIKSIFITHQLQIKTGNRFSDAIIRKINYHFIKNFNECWVADTSNSINAAGELSHPNSFPSVKTIYLGLLSRFIKTNTFPENKYDCCIVLSGPEPQRTILENAILQDLPFLKLKILLVRGKPQTERNLPVPNHVEVHNHLSGITLQEAFEQSAFILSRSGYTTVMEILSLQKKSILIPTPGQPEQEYLGKKLAANHLAYCTSQESFSLIKSWNAAASYPYAHLDLPIFNEKVLYRLLSGT
jgi:uncharacterized protein (TIGR00661 family)